MEDPDLEIFRGSQATQEAFERAGMKVMRILEEPTAAAIAYNLHKGALNGAVIMVTWPWHGLKRFQKWDGLNMVKYG